MVHYTEQQVLEIQRKWAKQRSDGNFWGIMIILLWILIMVPATRATIARWIAPIPVFGVAAAILIPFGWVANRYARCPGCNTVVSTQMKKEYFCPACGVELRPPR